MGNNNTAEIRIHNDDNQIYYTGISSVKGEVILTTDDIDDYEEIFLEFTCKEITNIIVTRFVRCYISGHSTLVPQDEYIETSHILYRRVINYTRRENINNKFRLEFEFRIPPDLPASISEPRASIKYQLYFEGKRKGKFTMNTRETKYLKVYKPIERNPPRGDHLYLPFKNNNFFNNNVDAMIELETYRFYRGNRYTGILSIDNKTSKSVKYIKLEFEYHGKYTGVDKKEDNNLIRNKFNQVVYDFWLNQVEDFPILPDNRKIINFEFEIPEDIPSSYHGLYIELKYFLKIHLELSGINGSQNNQQLISVI